MAMGTVFYHLVRGQMFLLKNPDPTTLISNINCLGKTISDQNCDFQDFIISHIIYHMYLIGQT